MLLLAALQTLTLTGAPQQIVVKNYCLSSLLSEPRTGCISWNQRETAGPLLNATQDLLYIGGSDGFLHLVSPKNGSVLKRIPLSGKLLNKPTLSGDNLLVATSQAHILNLDPKSLEIRWEQKLDSEIRNQSIADQNQVFVVTGMGTLYALELGTGEILWEKKRPESGVALSVQSNPLLLNKRLVIGNSSGKLEFIDISNGDTLFDVSLGNLKKPFPDITTDPVAVGNTYVAVASFNQGLSLLNAADGTLVWSITNLTNITQLAVADDLIIAAGPKQISGINWKTQEMVWKFSYLKGSPTKPIFHQGKIYFSSDQSALYVLNVKTGEPLQLLGSGLGFAANLELSAKGTLFALSAPGYLYRYDHDGR